MTSTKYAALVCGAFSLLSCKQEPPSPTSSADNTGPTAATAPASSQEAAAPDMGRIQEIQQYMQTALVRYDANKDGQWQDAEIASFRSELAGGGFPPPPMPPMPPSAEGTSLPGPIQPYDKNSNGKLDEEETLEFKIDVVTGRIAPPEPQDSIGGDGPAVGRAGPGGPGGPTADTAGQQYRQMVLSRFDQNKDGQMNSAELEGYYAALRNGEIAAAPTPPESRTADDDSPRPPGPGAPMGGDATQLPGYEHDIQKIQDYQRRVFAQFDVNKDDFMTNEETEVLRQSLAAGTFPQPPVPPVPSGTLSPELKIYDTDGDNRLNDAESALFAIDVATNKIRPQGPDAAGSGGGPPGQGPGTPPGPPAPAKP